MLLLMLMLININIFREVQPKHDLKLELSNSYLQHNLQEIEAGKISNLCGYWTAQLVSMEVSVSRDKCIYYVRFHNM